MAEKQCTKCSELKLLEDFAKDKRNADRRTGTCKTCTNARGREWREANPEKWRTYQRRSRKKHSEERNEYTRVWRAEHPEQYAETLKSCYARNYRKNILRQYGMTVEDYARIVDAQDNKCAICGKTETATQANKIQHLSVDHCHITGLIRGLLCNSCNVGIGRLHDDPKLLKAAASYLEDPPLESLQLIAPNPKGRQHPQKRGRRRRAK